MRTRLAFLLGLLAATAFASTPTGGADWPQWRGPNRTGHARDAQTITSLPKELNPVWKIQIGGGFSAPVVQGNALIYVDENGARERAHRVDAATGKEVWAVDYAKSESDEWGAGPRATAIIDEERVYVQSMNGEFRCLSLATGKTLWQTSFDKDFGVKFLGSKAREGTASRRGNNGSGVIAGERLVLPVGNTEGASLVCFNKVDGKVIWKSGTDEAAYSSLVTATLAGVPQVIAFTADALLGAALEDGRVLWRVPLKTNAKRHAATPVIDGDTVIVNSHTIGLVAFEIARDSGGFQAKPGWANTDLKINLATPVLVDGHLYCQGANRDYICAEAGTGQLKWSQPGFGQGRRDYSSTIVVGKNLLVLTEDGTLILLQPDPEKYTELSRLQVCGNTWSFPAYANGKLYVRDTRSLQCIDLGAK